MSRKPRRGLCACGYVGNGQHNLKWAIGHKRAHLKRFPKCDARTREILDAEITRKRKEQCHASQT